MKRWIVVGGLLAAGCGLVPPAEDPRPSPSSSPPSPKMPAVAYRDERVDVWIVSGPATMVAGTTQQLVLRALVPAGTRLVGLHAPPGTEAHTYALQLDVQVPQPAGPAEPMEVALPFTPPTAGTYYLDGSRRFAIPVTGAGGRSTSSFLDSYPYPSSRGGYVPHLPSPPSASTSVSVLGTAMPLATVTPGAVRGNPRVTSRKLLAIQGPTTGRRGQRLTWNASLWTSGSGPIAPDITELNGNELKVQALVAPAENELVSVPFPHETTMAFSWIFQHAGTYRIISNDSITLGTVTIH